MALRHTNERQANKAKQTHQLMRTRPREKTSHLSQTHKHAHNKKCYCKVSWLANTHVVRHGEKNTYVVEGMTSKDHTLTG